MSDAAYFAILIGFLFALGLIRVIVAEVLRPNRNSAGEILDQALGLLIVFAILALLAYLICTIAVRAAAMIAG